jgi:hypothetical protein
MDGFRDGALGNTAVLPKQATHLGGGRLAERAGALELEEEG